MKRYPRQASGVMFCVFAALAILGSVLWFTAPMAAVFVIIYSPLLAWGISTAALSKILTRTVVVVRPDAHMVCIDEQRWWRDDEIAIPDAAKREFRGRRVPFLYHVYGPPPPEGGSEDAHDAATGERVFKGLAVFDPWAEPLEFKDNTASAGHVAGIKADMKTAEAYAMYQEPDRREVIRYGLLVIVIGVGLMCAYLALGTVADAS